MCATHRAVAAHATRYAGSGHAHHSAWAAPRRPRLDTTDSCTTVEGVSPRINASDWSRVDDGALDAALAARCGAGLLAVVPDAVHVAPEVVPPAGADPETIAFAATRATTRLLRHLCLQRPCVLVIDDVHDADPASLRLLA